MYISVVSVFNKSLITDEFKVSAWCKKQSWDEEVENNGEIKNRGELSDTKTGKGVCVNSTEAGTSSFI